MTLRLVEITVPAERLEELSELLAGVDTVDLWTVEEGPVRGIQRALVPSEQVEALTDLVAGRFEGGEDFRVVLVAVEATFPPGEEEETEEERRGPGRVSREELHQDLAGGSRVTGVYLVTVALSAVVAAVGLVRDDVAVIIGAMVIAPLLAPNVALSLAATLGDVDLAKRALLASAAGASTALAVALLVGAMVSFDPETPQLLARSRVGPGDVVLALAAGSAGALAYTTGLPAVVIGVMVAVALLPPLVAAGIFAGGGYPAMAAQAALLTLTNATAVSLAGVVTFLAQKVRPRLWWEEERARTATKVALATWVALLVGLIALMIWVVRESP
ncbi:MAG: TIGR00341 family protein [Gemmatimonadota bacterium]